MRVLATGGAGFIGHHLVSSLVAAGNEVVVLDNLHRGSFERPGLKGARLVVGDVRDRSACDDAVHGCNAVVHLAAQSNVMGSEANPEYTFDANVAGTWNVARAVAGHGVDKLIFASSREVYGDCAALPVSERAPLRPKNVYGASKVAGEALLAGGAAGGASVRILRLANVVGPGDTGRVIPNWLRAVREALPLEVFGGGQELDFVPVETVVAAIESAISVERLDGPVNVGSGHPTPLLALAERLLSLYPATQAGLKVCPGRAPEVIRFAADVTRMRSVLGVHPPDDPLAFLPGPGDKPW
ncbi:MAG TPA: NAD-dependent epimerase/dehydratase family protein [Tepidiformaceae bacterium]|nr:NAD-dependent epimerase/dehydratase family protein [Tepidiformaceae bacterium]